MRILRFLVVMGAAVALCLVPSQVAAAAEAVPSAALAAAVPGTPCSSSARACVDRSSNQAWLIRNGRISYGPVTISHGGPGHRTPAGTFRVTFHSRHHVSSIYGTSMPYSVFFNGGIAFHQGDTRTQSHGCVRMSRASASEFFSSLRDGDVVQVV